MVGRYVYLVTRLSPFYPASRPPTPHTVTFLAGKQPTRPLPRLFLSIRHTQCVRPSFMRTKRAKDGAFCGQRVRQLTMPFVTYLVSGESSPTPKRGCQIILPPEVKGAAAAATGAAEAADAAAVAQAEGGGRGRQNGGTLKRRTASRELNFVLCLHAYVVARPCPVLVGPWPGGQMRCVLSAALCFLVSCLDLKWLKARFHQVSCRPMARFQRSVLGHV